MHNSTISSVPSQQNSSSKDHASKDSATLQPISEKPLNGIAEADTTHLTNGSTAVKNTENTNALTNSTHKSLAKTSSVQAAGTSSNGGGGGAAVVPSPRDINSNNLDVNKENIPLKVSKTTPTNLSSAPQHSTQPSSAASTVTTNQAAGASTQPHLSPAGLTLTDLQTTNNSKQPIEPVKNVIHFEKSLTLSQTSTAKDPMTASQISTTSTSEKAAQKPIEVSEVKTNLPQSASTTSTASSKASSTTAAPSTTAAAAVAAAKERTSIFNRGLRKSETVRASEMPKSNSIDKASLIAAASNRQSALPSTSADTAGSTTHSYRTKTELLLQNQKSNPLASVAQSNEGTKGAKSDIRPRYFKNFNCISLVFYFVFHYWILFIDKPV